MLYYVLRKHILMIKKYMLSCLLYPRSTYLFLRAFLWKGKEKINALLCLVTKYVLYWNKKEGSLVIKNLRNMNLLHLVKWLSMEDVEKSK